MDEKKKVVERIRAVQGRDPRTLNEFLAVLTHPDVVREAKAYLQVHDHSDACKKYQAPWNCAREAEAYSQTVHNGGWSGGMNDIIENWCVNCQAKLYGDDPGDIPEPLSKTWLEDPTEKLIQPPTEDLEEALLMDRKPVSDDVENPWLDREVDGC